MIARCGKSTCLKSINRMNDLIPNCRIEGEILVNDQDIYADNTSTCCVKRRHGFPKANPFPMSIYDNIYGPAPMA